MAERTSGVYRLVGLPRFYGALQDILGARAGRRRLVKEFIRPKPGDRLLDLGCGSAAILSALPHDIGYVGIDRNARHVEMARHTYGSRGVFHAGNFSDAAQLSDRSYDVILAMGLLHHLDDSQVVSLLKLAQSLLAPGGRLFTIDPAFVSGQSSIARFLIRNDSGQAVRDGQSYLALSRQIFPDVDYEIRHDLLRVPYTHCVMTHRV